MSEGTHTSGPWIINGDEIWPENDPENLCPEPIAIVSDPDNLVLIAAAPDLLEALIEILGPLNICSDNSNVRDDTCLPVEMTMGELRKARAAIARATGAA